MKDFSQLIRYSYKEIPYHNLMRKRIHKVMLLCSPYDAFLLEEDGRIDEKLFNEYTLLNLSRPPEVVIQSDLNDAFRLLHEDDFDLTIVMYEMGEMNPLEISSDIKEQFPFMPVVLLTPFSRDASLIIDKANLEKIDYVFSWLGDENLLLAIVKLIEDKMNADNDLLEIGVQTILLVEDSVRFYSVYLPNLYKLIFQQSKQFMTEGLNIPQQMMRMRGRPKILLANNYEQAIELFEKYENNILGVITDISYNRNGLLDKEAGLKLTETIKSKNPFVPVLIQSSEIDNKEKADALNAGFIDKNSKSLSNELSDFVDRYFAFGEFVFYDPKKKKEVARAENLKKLQECVMTISDESLQYHISGNNFSKWLYARAIFPIAEIFKSLSQEDFTNLTEIRQFIFDSISYYRLNKSKGIIAGFYKERFDEYFNFARIGDGSIGGKGRGLAFLDSMVKRNKWIDKWENTIVSIPPTVVVGVDVFSEFMKLNNLFDFINESQDDKVILKRFVQSKFPEHILDDLRAFVQVLKKPIAIRSSSLLEDSHYQPFAGVYSTYMIPFSENKKKMLCNLQLAMKSVYASVFYKNSRQYMVATKNVIDEEKMGLVLQEVCGNQHGNFYYPTLSGVGRSLNFYPLGNEKPEEGVVNLAFGLGKIVVDGGQTLRFSPKYPENILQLSSPEMVLKETQKTFYSLSLDVGAFKESIDDGVNIVKREIEEALSDDNIDWVTSTYDFQNNLIVDGDYVKGKKVLTFSRILKYSKFPLSEILQTILSVGAIEMNKPIEIEFAVEISNDSNKNHRFYLLQIRPIADNHQMINEDLQKIDKSELSIFCETSIGNGIINDLCDVVFVKQKTFNAANNSLLVDKIEKLNTQLSQEFRNYILIGPGRWGSSDPWLGIPVKWPQISNARLIIESSLENYMIDPSQGTHFFQNLTSFNVGYFTINQHHNKGFIDWQYFENAFTLYEDEFIKHVRFDHPLMVKIDTKKGIGCVFKSNIG